MNYGGGKSANKPITVDIAELRVPQICIGHIRINGNPVTETSLRCDVCGRMVWEVAFRRDSCLMGCDCRTIEVGTNDPGRWAGGDN